MMQMQTFVEEVEFDPYAAIKRKKEWCKWI